MKRRWNRLIPGLILAALLGFLATCRIRDPDIWLYLKSGEIFLQRGEILRTDIFSFTRSGQPWANHSWLSQAVFAVFFRAAGVGGLYLLRYLLLGSAFGLVYRSVRLNAGRTAAAVLTLAAILAAASRFVVRPELFTFVFLPLTVLVLERERKGKRSRLFLVPIIFLAWSNLHGGVILGAVILGAYCLGEGLMLKLKGPGPESACYDPKSYRRLLLWSGLSLVAAAANPLGPGIFLYSARISSLQPFIYAWQPLSWGGWPRWPLYQYVLVFLFLAAAAVLIRSRKRLNLSPLLILVLFGLAASRAARNIAPFALVAPALLAALRPGEIRLPGLRDRRSGLVIGVLLLAISLGVVGGELREVDPGRSDIHKVYGFGISPFSYPRETAEFIAGEGISGRLFNSFGIGNYLTWRLWPEKLNYVDGRLSVFGSDFLLAYNRLLNRPETFPDQAREWDFRAAVVDYPNPSNFALLRWLEVSPDWELVFFDSNSALYLHRDHPDREGLEGRLPRPEAAAASLPPREAFARGRFLLQAGRAEDSLPYLLRAGEKYPRAPVICGLIARACLETGEYAAGETFLDRAEQAGARGEWLNLARGRLALISGDHRRAIRLAEEVLAAAPRSAEAWEILGEARLEAGENREAEAAFLRAAEEKPSSRTALRLGDLAFRAGDFARAAEWYGKVGPDDPEYPRSRVYLGGALVQTGETERGREIFLRCGEDYPEFFQICRFNLAVISFREGSAEAARGYLGEITDPALLDQIAADPGLSALGD